MRHSRSGGNPAALGSRPRGNDGKLLSAARLNKYRRRSFNNFVRHDLSANLRLRGAALQTIKRNTSTYRQYLLVIRKRSVISAAASPCASAITPTTYVSNALKAHKRLKPEMGASVTNLLINLRRLVSRQLGQNAIVRCRLSSPSCSCDASISWI